MLTGLFPMLNILEQPMMGLLVLLFILLVFLVWRGNQVDRPHQPGPFIPQTTVKVNPTFPEQRLASDVCRSCSSVLDSTTKTLAEYGDLRTVSEVYSNLVNVLSCQHSLRKRRNVELNQRTIDLMVLHLIGKLTLLDWQDEILSIILRVSESHLQEILYTLTIRRQWKELKALADKAMELGRSLGRFAMGLPAMKLIHSNGISFLEGEVLKLLLDHGAQLPSNPRDVVKSALSNRRTAVAEVLLEKIHPPLPEDDDFSPLHAAFKIAVSKEKGNFQLFEKFLSLKLYRRKVDESGNTFLHLALQSASSLQSYRAVKFLVSKGLLRDKLNHSKQMAVDYLTESKSRHAEVLMDFFINGMEKLTEEELLRARAREDRWLEQRENLQTAEIREDERLGGKTSGAWREDELTVQAREDKPHCENTPGEELEEQPNVSAAGKKSTVRKHPSHKSSPFADAALAPEESSKEVNLQDQHRFEDLAWEVECTEKVQKQLKRRDMPLHIKEKIMVILKRLAAGERRRKDRRQLPNAKTALFEANITKGTRLIWETGISFSQRLSDAAGRSIYTDVIRVWDIVLDHDKIHDSVEKVLKSHRNGERCLSKQKLKRCTDCLRGDKGLCKPSLYHSESEARTNDALGTKSNLADSDKWIYPLASADEKEFLIHRFYDFTSNFEFSVLENTNIETDFPFRVTELEFKIIHLDFNSPTLLIGRSGTGKTTCCLYRLWTQFQQFWTFRLSTLVTPRKCPVTGNELPHGPRKRNDTVPDNPSRERAADVSVCHREPEGQDMHLHQVFVTKNPKLRDMIQKNFQALCHGDRVARQHVTMEKAQLPHRLQDVHELKFPLFLTSRELILMLDASLPGPHFFDAETRSVAFRNPSSPGLDLHDGAGKCPIKQSRSSRSCPNRDLRQEVTYDRFAQEIWPRLSGMAKVDYHPSLVWMEITSFIKGSITALQTPSGFLNLKGYEDVGRKQAPNFTGNREKIHEVFKHYREYNRQYGLYDETDMLFHIYQRLKRVAESRHSLPWVINEVYIDETQDFTQAELFLLICCIKQPNRMFFTGDTAQSIIRGVAFRFTDLKTLFYHAKEMGISANHRQLGMPTTIHQLTHNYRSHDGILRLTSGVLDLLNKFFPESFDNLERDHGLFSGPSPVLLDSSSRDELVDMLSGVRHTPNIVFGDNQVILVANDEARNNLPREMDDGIRMTIAEAKGLEFDDVLLYNFFTDSQAGEKSWRLVLTCLGQLCEESGASSSKGGLLQIHEDALRLRGSQPRNFDENKHKILNSELKHLYTALTRARAKVLIFDEDNRKRAPMFQYFKARHLVESLATRKDAEPVFAKGTSAEAWEKRGDDMMSHELYDAAVTCYRNACNSHKLTIAIVHTRMKAAELSQSRSGAGSKTAMLAFQKAAILFLQCHAESVRLKQSPEQRFHLATAGAGECLVKGGKHVYAAMVFVKNGQIIKAAEQYANARKWLEASRCYEKLQHFNSALRFLVRGSLYEEAVRCRQRYDKIVAEYKKNQQQLPAVLMDNQPNAAFTVQSLSKMKSMVRV